MQENPILDADRNFDLRRIYGPSNLSKIMRLNILVQGVTGLGIEVIKNLILSSPGRIAISDDTLVRHCDLGRNPYLTASQVNCETRAQASLSALRQLNPNVSIEIVSGVDLPQIVKDYHCVILLDNYDSAKIISCNQACRKHDVKFIYGGCLGLYGFLFNDFGQFFQVDDCDGEDCYSLKIQYISQQAPGIVSCYEWQRSKYRIKDGDLVVFSEVVGMEQINGKKFRVKCINQYSFSIGDTTEFDPYVSGGTVTLIKTSQSLRFKPFKQSLTQPSNQQIQTCFGIKNCQADQMHLILNGIFEFYAAHQRMPGELSQCDAQQLYQLSKKLQLKYKSPSLSSAILDEKLVRNVSYYCQTQISPVVLFYGGMIAQQALKIVGKFKPVCQWIHHHFFELLPQQKVSRQTHSTLRQDYVTLFGDQFLKVVARSRALLCGPVGSSQLIKMLGSMGVGSALEGAIFYDDDKVIRQEDLPRQFLATEQDVGKNSCQVLCESGSKIAPDCLFKPFLQNVEHIYFWQNLDFAVCAQQNTKKQHELDNKCIFHQKPLFQIEVKGTKGSICPVIPFETQSLADFPPRYEISFDYSTLKNFPYQIQHTAEISKMYFSEIFEDDWEKLAKLYQDKQGFVKNETETALKRGMSLKIVKQELKNLTGLYELNESKSYQKCVELAVKMFYRCFHHRLVQILNSFPPDLIVEHSNRLFWSGLKRVPSPIQLDVDDPLHLQFIQSTVNILAAIIKIGPLQTNFIKRTAVSILQDIGYDLTGGFKSRSRLCQDQYMSDREQSVAIQNAFKELLDLHVSKENTPASIQLDVENPAQTHIEFIVAASNLRARNYKIKQASRDEIISMTLKIIPKAITTICTTAGALGIEVIKHFLNKRELGPIPHATFTCNLALPLLVSAQCNPPLWTEDKQYDPVMMGPVKAIPSRFTKWDKIHLRGPMTVAQVKQKLERDYRIQVLMIVHEKNCLYSQWTKNTQNTIDMDVKELIEKISRQKITGTTAISLSICGTAFNQIDCTLPDIKYFL